MAALWSLKQTASIWCIQIRRVDRQTKKHLLLSAHTERTLTQAIMVQQWEKLYLVFEVVRECIEDCKKMELWKQFRDFEKIEVGNGVNREGITLWVKRVVDTWQLWGYRYSSQSYCRILCQRGIGQPICGSTKLRLQLILTILKCMFCVLSKLYSFAESAIVRSLVYYSA